MSATVLKRFGQHLRDLRQAAGLTQEELAHAAGLSQKYVSELEHGKTNPSLLVVLALSEKGLGITLASFLAFDATGDEVRDNVRELGVLLADQPQSMRRRLMNMIRAFAQTPGPRRRRPQR